MSRHLSIAGGAWLFAAVRHSAVTMTAVGCVLFTSGAAARDHSDALGNCTGVFLAADNPHILVGDCTVSAGETLTLEAGAVLDHVNRFQQLFVDGTFNASGAEIRNADVQFREGSGGTISDTTIERTADLPNVPAISITSSTTPGIQVTIDGATVIDSPGTAISISGTSQPTIDGVTIREGGIVVSGTASPTITANVFEDFNAGNAVRFEGGTTGTASGNTIRYLPSGASFRRGFSISGDASPLITSNTIEDDPTRTDIGFDVFVSEVSTASVTGNSLCSTGGDTAFRFTLGFFDDAQRATVSGNTQLCESGSAPLFEGTITTNRTLRTINGVSEYVLSDGSDGGSGATATVAAGSTLTLEPGVTLDIEGTSANNLLSVSGTLNATGATIRNADVRFNEGSSGTITNSVITQAASGSAISITSSTTPGIQVTIDGATVIDSPGTAISISGTSQPTIDGVTIREGGIVVSGTASPTITANVFEDFNAGNAVRFEGGTTGTASGNTIRYLPSGASFRRGFSISGDASPLITSNTIEDDPTRTDIGFDVFVSEVSTASVTGNSLCSTGGDTAFRFTLGFFDDAQRATVSGNTQLCESGSAPLFEGTITTNRTLRTINGVSEYVLSDGSDGGSGATATVAAGSTLTLEPGVTLDIEGTSANNLLSVSGTLNATGATIRNADVRFNEGSSGTITNSVIESNSPTAITITNASPSLIGNTFRNLSTAIALSGTTSVLIDQNLFMNNGVAINVGGLSSLSTVSANSFVENGRVLTFANADTLFQAFPTEFDSNVFLGVAAQNTVLLPSAMNVDGTLPASPAAYFASGNVTVSSGVDLTIPPGVVIKTAASRSITVADGARLVALGTPEFPIVFTATNPKTPGRWNGLRILGNGSGPLEQSILQNCVIEFSQVDGLTLTDASIEIDGCRISDNLQDGIELAGSSAPLVTNSAILSNLGNGVRVNVLAAALTNPIDVILNSIFSNGAFGINNLTPAALTVNGENNYWGSDSGPFDPSDDRPTGLFNVTGLGQSVSDGVDYDPWIRLGPSIQGTITAMSGLDQVGQLGELLPEPITVEVRSVLGSPLEGVEVIFSITEGDATIIEPQPLLTDANGQASAQVRIGATLGEIRIAATARDVNSPLAAFLAEADAPCLFAITALASEDIDTDEDGVPDSLDNCPATPNPLQRDTDGDGYGNMCDADLNGDDTTDFMDLGIMKSSFLSDDPHADLNGDGNVDFLDLGMLKSMFFEAPGS